MQTTPKRCSYDAPASVEQFSPVIVPESPVSKISQRGNLTGNPRLVRDLAAGIHASIQQWNSLHLHGVSLLKAITQLKVDEKYPDGLQSMCDELEKDCGALDDIVCNLEMSVQQLKTIESLHKNKENLFLTWPIDKFGHIAQQIFEAYRDELEVKRKVSENIAHGYSESWKMLHLATWVHQTRISENLTTLLESMLVETGLR